MKKDDRLKNTRFADLLECLLAEGHMYFYEKDGAELILNTVGEKGLLTKEGLALYRVADRVPLKSDFRGKTIYTNPAPSAGGTLITFILQLLERSKTGTKSELIDLIRAMQITSSARREISIDMNNEFQISQLLEPRTFSHYLRLYDSGSTPSQNEKDPVSRGATTHVSIIDKHGNAASVTTTNGEGCGYIIPELGMMLNNMLGEEDLNPMGFHQWAHQRRLPTMISPTIVMGEKGVELVLGSGGSNRLRSAISQVILNLFAKKMDLEAAVHTSRIHLEGNVLHYEPGTILEPSMDDIRLHPWDENNLFFGGVNAVSPSEAIGDPRRGGTGMIH